MLIIDYLKEVNEFLIELKYKISELPVSYELKKSLLRDLIPFEERLKEIIKEYSKKEE
jgi:hypothetical protein